MNKSRIPRCGLNLFCSTFTWFNFKEKFICAEYEIHKTLSFCLCMQSKSFQSVAPICIPSFVINVYCVFAFRWYEVKETHNVLTCLICTFYKRKIIIYSCTPLLYLKWVIFIVKIFMWKFEMKSRLATQQVIFCLCIFWCWLLMQFVEVSLNEICIFWWYKTFSYFEVL